MKKVVAAAAAVWGLSVSAGVPEQIQALGEDDRRSIFKKLLSSEDRGCSTIKATFFQGSDSSGAAFWSVQCAGNAYQVMIKNNATGSSKVMDCETMKVLGLSCFKKFK